MTQFSKIDISILNAINRRVEKINEAGGNPEKTVPIIKEIMSDPEVKTAFKEWKSKENQDDST